MFSCHAHAVMEGFDLKCTKLTSNNCFLVAPSFQNRRSNAQTPRAAPVFWFHDRWATLIAPNMEIGGHPLFGYQSRKSWAHKSPNPGREDYQIWFNWVKGQADILWLFWESFPSEKDPRVNSRAPPLYSRIVGQKLKVILENELGVRSPDRN